jgi:hypothetical protein
MKLQSSLLPRIPARGMAFLLASLFFACVSVQACTIFVLTDTTRALFCNNEDWSNPKTRIWFMPAGDGYYGGVYVGFDDRIIAVAQDTGSAVPVQSEKLAPAAALIRGPAGTTVRLTVVSSGEDDSRARIVSFVRAELKTPPH